MNANPHSKETPAGNDAGLDNEPATADDYRNPRATRKAPDMPEDQGGHHPDPDNDYAKPDGSERRAPRSP